VITELADVGFVNDTYVTLDYSFDLLAIVSEGKLFYWNGSLLTQVTDPDLGTVNDAVWVDGYFMTTDGVNLVVTELTDPTQVNPLKYGSSEIDPDDIVALLKIRNEIYALNRYSIEIFTNIGGEFFPFQRIEGAEIPKGTVGTYACCVFMQTLAFLGSGRNESPGIYLGENSTAKKISSQEIDYILEQYTEEELSQVKLEARNDKSHQHLYVHLPDRTLVFDGAISPEIGQAVWFVLTSTLNSFEKYRARNFVWHNNKWFAGDTETASIGYFLENVSSHWGNKTRWEFSTSIVYNEGNGGLFHELELVSLPGRVLTGLNPQLSTSYSTDGMSWSQERFISAGTTGATNKRLVWLQQGHMRNWRIQRFKGTSDAHLSFARLEAQLEGLAY
jgi:hypothetical protein